MGKKLFLTFIGWEDKKIIEKKKRRELMFLAVK